MESWDAYRHYDLVRKVSKPRVRRYLLDNSNPVESFDDVEFYNRYRFTKQSFFDLLKICEAELVAKSERGLPIPPLLKLCAALRFYATGSFQIVTGDLENISQSSISILVKEISEILAKNKEEFVKFPKSAEEVEIENQRFFILGRFPGVVGALDCTHIKIQCPGGESAELFRNRKGFFSINVQAICNANLELTNIVVRWRGSVHDARIFENSAIGMQFEAGLQKGILLGDNGYPCKCYLLTPLLNPSSGEEHRYNRAHIKCRTTIERTFGIWKRMFPCLSFGLRLKVSTSLTVIVATAVLYNFARMHK